jgi:membrane protease YdiL (CAAX protease family)
VRRNLIAGNKILGLSVLGGFIYLVGWTVHRISAALNVSLDPGTRTTTSYVLIYLVGVVSTAAFARFVWGPSLWDHVARYWTKRKQALMGFAVTSAITMLAAGALALLMLVLLGTPIWSAAVLHSFSLRRVTISDPSWIGAMLVAIVEEVAFRGIIFNYLLLGTGPWRMPQALVGSALIFALAHRVREPLSLFSLEEVPCWWD